MICVPINIVVVSTAGRASAGAAKGDKSVDIDKLKKEVEERGGYARVEERREWRQTARAPDMAPPR